MANMINAMCWNVEGIMSGTPYLIRCLEQHDIHICGLSEHWLREFNMSFFNTFESSGYSVIAKSVFELDPFRYKCNIRGGVALLYRNNKFKINEIVVDNPGIVGDMCSR